MPVKYFKNIEIVITSLLAAAITLPVNANPENGEFFGNLRTGFITTEDSIGNHAKSSAIGGKLGYVTPQWNSLSVGATVYGTEELFDNEEGNFFGADGDGYTILGEAFLQASFGNTEIKGGRFEFDSPHADTDDVRMVPNTFQGAVLSNTDLADTTIHLGHLSKWAGVDSSKPEEFTHLNDDEGVSLIGVVYEGFKQLSLQAWYYDAEEFAELAYFEAVYSADNFELGAQFGSQDDGTSGPNDDVYGVYGSVNIRDFTLLAAYNNVSGTVTNGFGGGPFFTSCDDHTIADVKDQEAIATGVEYGGIAGLTLGIFSVDFDKSEDEINYYVAYEVNNNLSFELTHADIHGDGEMTRLIANLSF